MHVIFAAILLLAAIEPVNTPKGELAVRGYDVVAYFDDAKAVEGSAEHAAMWNGATWRFASPESKAKFLAEPAKYAPRFGGYCAWAVSRNYTADADPTAWKIVDGKLYLNYNAKVQGEWQKDIPGNIEKATANWPKLLNAQ
jgi:YHS domain-containing protein